MQHAAHIRVTIPVDLVQDIVFSREIMVKVPVVTPAFEAISRTPTSEIFCLANSSSAAASSFSLESLCLLLLPDPAHIPFLPSHK